MTGNPRDYVENADIGEDDVATEAVADTTVPPLDLDRLPAGVVSGTALIDFTAVSSAPVRAGVSLAMLFASRVATKAMRDGDDADDWLAHYTSSLNQLGFALAGSAVVHSTFRKTGLAVHQAIIPFLTVAFGGAAIGPVILAGLKNLQETEPAAPWITLFDSQTRRFSAREMHFAAVSSDATDTAIRYAIARVNVTTQSTNVLFFRLTRAEAAFDSVTTTMSANNSLLAVMEPDMRARLGMLAHSFIMAADL